MSGRWIVILVCLVMVSAGPVAGTARADWWVGGGIHYLRNLGDISNDGEIDLDQNSFSLILSAKRNFGFLMLDGQAEYIFDYLGTGESMVQPSLWGLLGGLIYGGAGIGIGHTDGEWQTNPFYALRLGTDLRLGDLNLDVYATYRFQSSQDLETLTGEDLDSITLAALLRFRL